MKIILTQTGGFIGRTKTAEAKWPFSAKEFDELVEKIQVGKSNKSKDGYEYFIRTGSSGKDKQVSITGIEKTYAEVFDELFKNLKPLKE